MTTYQDLYDQMLDECCTCETCGRGGSSLRDDDPIAYCCGFSDWQDSLRDSPPVCDCGRTITDFDVCMEDDVECSVCSGEQFECDECGGLFDIEELNQADDKDLCEKCWEEEREKEDE